ncbi:tetratricopeptide repeat-containing sensor histidine kinase [Flavobacterium nitratireducens]|uniref:tetratricopeptide repeat-containing sensor histidine kinase n=1 Tax=Flavobacterium nitratireducens TaxID=992289 RepID=UPI00241567FA|nr:sensor histidine kinase [Flavobacterium nitratireducens]
MSKTLFIFLLCTGITFSQKSNHAIDSLKNALKICNKLEKLKTLIQLSDEYSNIDLEQSKKISYLALSQSRLQNNPTYIAMAFNCIANVHQYKSELDSALYFHKKALSIRKSINDSLGMADTYNNIGIVYDSKGQFDAALKYYFKALYFYEKKKDNVKQAMTNTNIGIIYKAQKEYSKALLYYRRAIALYFKTSDKLGQTMAVGNLGGLLINFKKYQESLKYSFMAKKGYLQLGCERFVAYPLSNIAIVYDSLHKYDFAEKNYLKVIQLHEQFKNSFEVAENANAFALCLIKQKKYRESIAFSLKALSFAKKSKANLLEVYAYKNLHKAHSQLKEYHKANHFAGLYISGKDSLFESDKTKIIFDLETKYQTAKKEQLLIQKEAETKQKNILLIGVSVLAVLVGLIGFLIYRQQRLRNKQQEQEFELKNAIQEIETQNKLQQQRLDISRDLHDNIGAQLIFIISSIDTIKYAFDITNKKLDDKLSTISSFTKSTIVELRDTIWAMNSSEITFEDLKIRIHNFIEKAKEAKDQINFLFSISNDVMKVKLSSVEGMNLYRIIQEAVNNSIKYSEATSISIHVVQVEKHIQLTIQDNGSGFDYENIEKGNGLQNMQDRIEAMGGEFNLVSQPGKGTSINLLFTKKA